jgi:hypothetical protein
VPLPARQYMALRLTAAAENPGADT